MALDSPPPPFVCQMPNNCPYGDPKGNEWPLAIGSMIGLAMAYGIGANDAANSWGTSVGSGAIPVWIAVIIGGFMDFLGAVTLGAGVSGTISKGVAQLDRSDCWACTDDDDDSDCGCSKMGAYQVAMLAALLGGALFLLLATYTAMPVSTTHAIVGGVVGATLAGTKFGCLNWAVSGGLSGIVLSWVISPVLAGIIGVMIFGVTRPLIFDSLFPEKMAVASLPFLLSITTYIVTFSIVYKQRAKLGNLAGLIVIPLALAAVSVAAGVLLMKKLRKKLARQSLMEIRQMPDEEALFSEEDLLVPDDEPAPATQSFLNGHGNSSSSSTAVNGTDEAKKKPAAKQEEEEEEQNVVSVDSAVQTVGTEVNADQEEAENNRSSADIVSSFRPPVVKTVKGPQLPFQYLLVFVAAVESFAHGSNDTANATGAFGALFQSFKHGTSCTSFSTPWWIMGIAGLFVGLGVIVSGRKVIETVGLKLTDIDCHMGFCIELATTSTVIGATILQLPVSTTHCQVGAVVFLGAYRSGLRNVEWSTFGRIGLSWLVTLPFAGFVGFFGTLILLPAAKS